MDKKKVDFRNFPVYASIKKDKTVLGDICEFVSNYIYTKCKGLAACSLAMDIFKNGEVELDEKQVKFLLQVSEGFPCVLADSIKDYLNT